MPHAFHLDGRLALDPALLQLDAEQFAFLQSTTGIQDEEALKRHILAAQAEAYAVFPYSSIRSFTFLRLGISRNPVWRELLEVRQTLPHALLLDVGCCLGTDIRKAVYDGWSTKSVIATDIIPEFWELGRRLFCTQTSNMPSEDIRFIQGDILDSSFFATVPPLPTEDCSIAHTPELDLKIITTLTEVQHCVSAIHLSAIFHLFSEASQVYLARALAGLLASHRGACIFGWSVASTGSGAELVRFQNGVSHPCLWVHSPTSWIRLWGEVFGETQIKTRADVRDFETDVGLVLESGLKPKMLIWSVTRV
ncbi:hypothetical protein PENSPDRAFT_637324 [Peniophora sp. CONT]|nr:hypothetical protein PENSPDRAFT_637324 [Peniophora sp. CONT]